jgi:aminoglycoside phosphotransferase family enzyme
MELAHLIDALSVPAAYPYAVETVDVRHTHISVVFLAGPFAYKLKKPVRLKRRRHFCEEEVRLNRRLAPDVYLGVVPVSQTTLGMRIEARGVPDREIGEVADRTLGHDLDFPLVEGVKAQCVLGRLFGPRQ